jgi:hypothetical protein
LNPIINGGKAKYISRNASYWARSGLLLNLHKGYITRCFGANYTRLEEYGRVAFVRACCLVVGRRPSFAPGCLALVLRGTAASPSVAPQSSLAHGQRPPPLEHLIFIFPRRQRDKASTLFSNSATPNPRPHPRRQPFPGLRGRGVLVVVVAIIIVVITRAAGPDAIHHHPVKGSAGFV